MQPLPVTAEVLIREVVGQDSAAIAQIYNHYVLNTIATFEEQAVVAEQMVQRIDAITAQSLPWLVVEFEGKLAGYCYACAWKARSAYRHAVEIAVYIETGHTASGLGARLYQALFAALRKQQVHSVVAGIAQPNPGCVALHEKFGLRKVAHFSEIGFKFGQWIDVAYWQRTL